jgi:glycine/D-amino acid oxidase-like deaminating enzyme
VEFTPYWHASAPRFAGGASGPVEGDYDVAVIGAGFTGLGAARKLAQSGARVAVLEAATVASGASGRNGGHLNNGIAHSFAEATQHYGAAKAAAMYRAYDAGIETIERIIAEEGIDCAFRRSGKLKLASKPAHFDGIARNYEAVRRSVDPDIALLSRADLGNEIGSDAFFGATLQPKSAMMHMGRFGVGLAEAAARRGAAIYENAPVTERRPSGAGSGAGSELVTPRGRLRAAKVFLATGAYTTSAFGYFRRRFVPVGSFLLATRPLSHNEARAVMPGNRTCVTSLNVGNYFRLSPDNRMIFGGRARFAARSDQRSDAKSGTILHSSMARIFPQLADIEIAHCWGGLVDITRDRFPRAGFADGLYFSMGYSGHGAQIATHMGETMADIILGRANHNPWADLPWEAVPLYAGRPWFLPLVGAYYKFLDRIR